jgi:hypothetical protein
MRLPVSAAFALLSAVVPAARATAQASSGGKLLMGSVSARETGALLDHAMVTIQPAQRQTFTSESGVFAFAAIAPGTYRIRVTHLGYAPAEISAIVPAEGAPGKLKIELSLVQVHLATVNVKTNWVCTSPGPPDPATNPDFAGLIGQLQLNAEHYQLLADSFPFRYLVRRVMTTLDGADVRRLDRLDTVAFVSSNRGWRYRVGDVIGEEGHEYVLRLPTLKDFASSEFLSNHCFRYAGRDSTSDGPMFHIDFRAAERISQPDVNGSILLDAGSYQIRRATLELSRIPTELGDIRSVSVQTAFGEISPSIVVFSEVIGNNVYRQRANWRLPVSSREEQHIFEFNWLRSNPSATVPAPPPAPAK